MRERRKENWLEAEAENRRDIERRSGKRQRYIPIKSVRSLKEIEPSNNRRAPALINEKMRNNTSAYPAAPVSARN